MSALNNHEKLLNVVIPAAFALLWGLFLAYFEIGFFAR